VIVPGIRASLVRNGQRSRELTAGRCSDIAKNRVVTDLTWRPNPIRRPSLIRPWRGRSYGRLGLPSGLPPISWGDRRKSLSSACAAMIPPRSSPISPRRGGHRSCFSTRPSRRRPTDLLARYSPELVLASADPKAGASAIPTADTEPWSSRTGESAGRDLKQVAELFTPTSASFCRRPARPAAPIRPACDSAVSSNARSIATALAIVASDPRRLQPASITRTDCPVLNSHSRNWCVRRSYGSRPARAAFLGRRRATDALRSPGPLLVPAPRKDRLRSIRPSRLRTMTQAGGKLDDTRVERFHRLMASRGGRFSSLRPDGGDRPDRILPPTPAAQTRSAGRASRGRLEIEVQGLPRTCGGTGEIVYTGPT